jgi:hypothetical protein
MTTLLRTGARLTSALRLFPRYLSHLVFHPYRTCPLHGAGGRGWRLAAYDLFLELLLDGYAEITGRPTRPEAAELLIRVNRVAFLMDDEFERRIGKESVAFDEIASATQVSRAIADMRAYLDRACLPAQRDAIRQLLHRTVDTEYRRYALAIERRRTTVTVEDLLEDAAVDSGAVVRQLAEVVGLFHGDAAPQKALDDFYALGMACKFADDLRDWRRDHQTGAGNLVLAILRTHPNEAGRLARAQTMGLRMTERRWNHLCPQTFGEFADRYAVHYSRIRSRTLRVAADLMMETGRVGGLPSNDEPTAARR